MNNQNAVPFEVIDVSRHNGKIDFEKVKAAGIKGVIIRAGYGKTAKQEDEMFHENYSLAKAAGLWVGAYWYSYASTEEEARQEAEAFKTVIKGKSFELPVYLDIEEKCSQANAGRICVEFCDAMECAGYFVGIYASRSFLESYISAAVRQTFTIWVAEWGKTVTYKSDWDMWQYSCTGKVDGISGDVDRDMCVTDFPSIIRKAGLNGLKSDTKKHTIEVYLDGDLVSTSEVFF